MKFILIISYNNIVIKCVKRGKKATMLVNTIIITLNASWVQSLKEKRMVIKSLMGKAKNKFNISIAEVGHQDNHKLIVLGIAYIAADNAQADSIYENIISFIETASDAEITDIKRDWCRSDEF